MDFKKLSVDERMGLWAALEAAGLIGEIRDSIDGISVEEVNGAVHILNDQIPNLQKLGLI